MVLVNTYLSLDLKSRISKFRQPLMGFAIIWVFMLHSGKTGNMYYDAIRFYGWAGVDFFFFLSAIGLCYSLSRDNNILNFYKKRIIRILPTWLLVLIMVHLAGLVCNYFFPKLPFYVPNTVLKSLTWYTGLGFWISDFVVGDGWYYEWYVPSLLMFYAFTPFLFKKNNSSLMIMILLFILLGVIFALEPLYQYIFKTHFFYQRIPIFLLGILYFNIIKKGDKTFNMSLILCVIIGVILIFLRNINIVKIPITYDVLFLSPPCLILLSYLISNNCVRTILTFYGTISLELYLIHLYKRPNYLVSMFICNNYLIIFVSLILCTIVAYVLNRYIAIKISNSLKKIVFQNNHSPI